MPKRKSISVIVPSYNDFSAFLNTFKSIENQLKIDDELVIVDSSDNASQIIKYINKKKLKFKVSSFWIRPSGIYPAMNYGIKKCNNSFIQILNCGDIFLPHAREKISKELNKNLEVKIYVFDQLSGYKGNKNIRFSPTNKSLWPHQSILVHKEIYKKLGFYNENFRLISDQIFFSRARKLKKHIIINSPITYYDLDGASSLLSLINIRETFILWRFMGKSRLYSSTKSVSLILKVIAKKIIGSENLTKLRIILFPYYSND